LTLRFLTELESTIHASVREASFGHTLANIFGQPIADIRVLMEEIDTDRSFNNHVSDALSKLLPGACARGSWCGGASRP
jgi:hypothetical protein